MGIIRKIVHVLSFFTYLLIGVYVIALLPFVVGYTPLVVLTGSMEPTYMTGSVIYYKSVSKEELKQGDVITYNADEDTVVTHRIDSIDENNNYVTKGDANDSVDPVSINYENVRGKVVKYNLPYVGYYISFINSNLYVIAIVAVILISEFLLGGEKTDDINKKKKGEKTYEQEK